MTHKKRRWFSLSLRTIFICVTLFSGGLAWFAYRRNEIRQVERLAGAVRASGGFADCLQVAFDRGSVDYGQLPLYTPFIHPKLYGVYLRSDHPEALTHEFLEAARTARRLRFNGTAWDDESFSSCLSENTLALGMLCPRVTRQGLASLERCPKLSSLDIRPDDQLASLFELLPQLSGLRRLSFSSSLKKLADLPRSDESLHVDSLTLHLDADTLGSPSQSDEDGTFAWLGGFSRARKLHVLGKGSIDDRLMRAIAERCLGLESLDISDGNLSCEGLQSLAKLPRLTKLHLDGCVLASGSVTALAEFQNLEYASLFVIADSDENLLRNLLAPPNLRAVSYTTPTLGFQTVKFHTEIDNRRH